MTGTPPGVRIVQVDAAAGRALRMSVLRPHEPPERAMYAAEDDPSTLHFAAIGAEGEALAVGSVMPDPYPAEPRPGDWRIRGMATRPDLRGRGLGAGVLAALEAAARERGGERIWCNARSGAREFYARAGYGVAGGEFEIAGIGPHFVMVKALR